MQKDVGALRGGQRRPWAQPLGTEGCSSPCSRAWPPHCRTEYLQALW